MKNRLNILCLLVVLVLSFSVFQQVYFIAHAGMDGFRAGMDAAAQNSIEMEYKGINMRPLAFMPKTFGVYSDSIYNTVSQSNVPMHLNMVLVDLDAEQSLFEKLVDNLCNTLSIIAKIFAVVWFIKLIISINKKNIFCWANVRWLRKLGIAMIVAFVGNVIPLVMSAITINEIFANENYNLMLSGLVDSINLVLGLVSLIVAQIFALGLRMQEEQELTI